MYLFWFCLVRIGTIPFHSTLILVWSPIVISYVMKASREERVLLLHVMWLLHPLSSNQISSLFLSSERWHERNMVYEDSPSLLERLIMPFYWSDFYFYSLVHSGQTSSSNNIGDSICSMICLFGFGFVEVSTSLLHDDDLIRHYFGLCLACCCLYILCQMRFVFWNLVLLSLLLGWVLFHVLEVI